MWCQGSKNTALIISSLDIYRPQVYTLAISMIIAFGAALVIASLSLLGGIFFGTKGKIAGAHGYILPIAVGVFLGIVFFDLIPETIEASRVWGPVAIAIGFFGFYLLSHILNTFHHHHSEEHDTCVHNSARLLLVGGAVHNFTDGIVVASACIVSPLVGVLTALGIGLHEIPQEVAKFGMLLRGGCSRKQALQYNFLSASSIFLGVAFTYLFAEFLGHFSYILTGVAAGNLLYIATSDFIPELRESHKDHFYKTFVATLIGIVGIGALIAFSHSLNIYLK